MSFRVLVTCTPMLMSLDECQERFKAENLDVVAPKIEQQLSEAELSEMVADFDGVITGDDPFTERVLERGHQGRLVTTRRMSPSAMSLRSWVIQKQPCT